MTATLAPTASVTMNLPRHARAAAQARRVLETVAPVDSEMGDTAVLLLSEVISNAVRYAQGARIGVAVAYDEDDGTLTAAVFDEAARMGSGARRGDAPLDKGDAPLDKLETGRGLDLLDALATKWGVAMVGDRGKWVWFRVAHHPGESGAHH
ncbi:ATP-binding protein [Streptomyces sp. NPDC052040]|uniref:ATP-binding protein n=1 Tax=unclassified Streptomyces TaxID=2593676 RepID=UPI0037D8F15A